MVAALLPTNARNLESSWSAAIALVVTVQLAWLYPQISAGEVIIERLAWIPSLGIELVVRVDGFAWMFAEIVIAVLLLASGVVAVVAALGLWRLADFFQRMHAPALASRCTYGSSSSCCPSRHPSPPSCSHARRCSAADLQAIRCRRRYRERITLKGSSSQKRPRPIDVSGCGGPNRARRPGILRQGHGGHLAH